MALLREDFDSAYQQSREPKHIEERILQRNMYVGEVPSSASYADMYRCGAAELHIHVGRGSGVVGGNLPVYCGTIRINHVEGRVVDPNTHPVDSYSPHVRNTAEDNDQLSMLVGVFKATDDSQEFLVNQGALIGLRDYDRCHSAWLQPTNGPLEIIAALVVLNHEVSVLIGGPKVIVRNGIVSILSLSARHVGNHDMVERTSEIVHEVPYHDGEHGVGLLSNANRIPDLMMAVGEPDSNELVRVGFRVGASQVVDVYHVLLSALDLEPPGISHVDSPPASQSGTDSNAP